MSAHPHTRPRSATPGGVDSRLPWWALVLPALGFAVLLALVVNPSGTHTGDPALAQLLRHIQTLLGR
ncbi:MULTISPECIES: hypothetical protein [Streptomyces]|uniref:Uncharacterized protein n=1 Tax=Streptomyces thermoviolaceus subsp. thermoviolaceus TaxID=66860 RepID=A0ABX0YPI9_STRTL|nr:MULTISPECIES: hypothetical protein [Streptomyces]MCM3266264.1 hypothetical protein [Streptomyces thermoviolaceus]NJP14334.1 hypothetical protein [Streptomyces thermoviolaceus subsp. thermoviolaceus]RSS00728.1 hypothetical protein EF917_16905 [Streptomyces sp. WAC00469]WTD49789.1 hypothetical protein OG899_21065 [Streptomyces thermoviolaceus]GGV81511.1 hypothetical protein GCM10010499_46020 [Streptomyces thermoviolaceus subsp. apingens]